MNTCKNALRIISRHWAYALIYLVLVSQIGVFSALAARSNTQTELAAPTPSVSIVDRDGSDLSKGLASFVEASGEAVPLEDSRRAMQDALAQQRTDFILIIPAGFGKDLEAAATRGAPAPTVETVLSKDSSNGPLMKMSIETYLNQVVDYLAVSGSADSAIAQTKESMGARSGARLIANKTGALPEAFVVASKMSTYPLFAFSVVAVSMIMIARNKRATRSRILASPETGLSRSLGLLAACLIVGALGWAWMSGLNTAIFSQGHLSRALPLFGVVGLSLFAYTLVGVSIGFLLGQSGVGENGANAIANIGGMLFAFLSGAWVPREFLPEGVVTASRLTPCFWVTQAIDGAYNAIDMSARTIQPLLMSCGIVLLFAAALAAAGLAVGRNQSRVFL